MDRASNERLNRTTERERERERREKERERERERNIIFIIETGHINYYTQQMHSEQIHV